MRASSLSAARIVGLVLTISFASPDRLAAQEWIELSSPRMTVLSQVSEKRTREWAAEFDQFIDALNEIISVNEALLPPLTVILFRRSRDFSDYQIQTESGAAVVEGVFVNTDTWSVMSLVAGGSLSGIDRITYHEAVHWLMAADPFVYPLWFTEGMAEVFSTYRISRGNVRWGAAIPEAVSYLRQYGLQSMRQFLLASLDAALHDEGRFYPQAWAFVHYMMFGQGETGQDQLQTLARGMRASDIDQAFAAAFDRSFEEVGSELEAYLANGSYAVADMPVADIAAVTREYVVKPAESQDVTLGLARLALGTGNMDLASEHLDELERSAGDLPTTYDLRSAWATRTGDRTAAAAALDRAIALGSEDARTFEMQAGRLIEEHLPADGAPPDQWFSADVARSIINAASRSIEISPLRIAPYEIFINALMSLDTISEDDRRILDFGKRVFVNEGMFEIGLAVVAYTSGNPDGAIAILANALFNSDLGFTGEFADVARYLHADWSYERVIEDVTALTSEDNFSLALATIDAEIGNGLDNIELYDSLRDLRQGVESMRRLNEVETALRAGDIVEGRRLLEAIIADPNVSASIRSDAQLLLQQLD